MAENNLNLREQLAQHLESLKVAGVDFLSSNAKLVVHKENSETKNEQRKSKPISLFGEVQTTSLDVESRGKALQQLASTVAECTRCPELYATRTQTVFGTGDPFSPEICFVGEAPGADEDRVGEPFVGRAGQLLNQIIAAMGLKREEVYICNTLKCRPPNNATPTPKQCANCWPYFEEQIDLVKPKYICCLGGVAAKNVLKTTTGITKLRGQWFEFRGIPVICTFHPAALLRDPRLKKDTWDDMQTLLKRMGKPIPKPKQK